MKMYHKAQRKITSLISKAIKERDAEGYRENLGYDQERELLEYLDTTSLTYREKDLLIKEFYIACSAI